MSDIDNSTALALVAALNNLAAQMSALTSQMASTAHNGKVSVDVTGIVNTRQG